MRDKFGLYADYSATELGAVFGIATNNLKDKINKAGVEPSMVNGSQKRYKIADVYQGLMDLKSKEYAEQNLENPKSHKERLDMLKAEEQEIKNRELRGELVDKHAILKEMSSALTKIKSRMLTLPKKMSTRAMELLDRGLIEDEMDTEIREILEELSQYEPSSNSTGSDEKSETTEEDDD